jgi:hypothetical protein
LTALFSERTPLGSFWLLLLFVFLLTWAGGTWLVPFGPTLFEVTWLPFLVAGIFITIILAATVPNAPPQPTTVEEVREEQAAESALGGLTIFFWVTLLFSIAAIILAYLI